MTDDCFSCSEYDIPEWLAPFTSFLWFLFVIDCFVAFYWMNFMWNHQKCRESIFKFVDDRESNVEPLPGQAVRSCCCWVVNVPKDNCCGCFQSCFTKAENTGKTSFKWFKQCFCLPDGETNEEVQLTYNYYNDIVKSKVTDDEVTYGHKAFFWPRDKPSWTFSTRSRITFSLTRKYIFVYRPIGLVQCVIYCSW